MKSVFHKLIGGNTYTFYRTTPGNEVIYFILYSDKDQKKSLRIERNYKGSWDFASELNNGINPFSHEFLELVALNEK